MKNSIKAIEIKAFGGPENMQLVDKPLPVPGPGEVRVRLRAIGVNLIDTYHRTGLYPIPLPSGLGVEGAGEVEAVGDGIDLPVGARVAMTMALGAYAEAIILPAAALITLPDAVSFEQAAAILLKGMTVDYLFHDTFPLTGGETVLFHAAAGGVGLIACQWARHIGVNLVGTASTDEKCALAETHGAQICVLSGAQNLPEKLKALAPEGGFPVVYDSVGKDTYRLGLEVLAPLGTFASFGNASGAIEAVAPQDLAAHGSLNFTRPTLATYMAKPGWLQQSSAKVLQLVEDGVLSVEINQRYRLAEAQRVHEDLEARATTGCSIITP
ncbi:MAG TPA: quinone oxidoreductase [Rhodobiaceae bacterium]|jgi:NADPH2:quinone reductase|nr:quinone oxidoreductase [Rhodobiaceae bacterium]